MSTKKSIHDESRQYQRQKKDHRCQMTELYQAMLYLGRTDCATEKEERPECSRAWERYMETFILRIQT